MSESRKAGCRRIFLRQILATSNGSRPGAARVEFASRAATRAASGSPKSSAPAADASTTLVVTAVLSHHVGGFGWRRQAQSARLLKYPGWRQPAFDADDLIQ